MRNVSVIIPNFNGSALLRENLPMLLASLKSGSSKIGYEVIVVDDGSTDGSVDLVVREFPEVKVIRQDKNYGFSYSCNAGARAAEGEIIYLLNSDIKVAPGFLEHIAPHFNDKNTFAVSSSNEPVVPPGKKTSDEIGLVFTKFKYGIFWYWYENISKRDYLSSGSKGIEVFCVSGGHTAYDKKKYLELGGFDSLFSPFYAEDGDICWRAWKRGWRSLIEPRSVIVHESQGTIGKLYPHSEILKIHWKNRFLMMWKDLTSARLWLKHILFIAPEVIICPLIGKSEVSRGFFSALKQIPEMLRSRRRDRALKEAYTDEWLFTRFSDTSRFPPNNILYLHETAGMGGAENSLLNLVMNLDKARFRPLFACPPKGLFTDSLHSAGVKVYPVIYPRVRNLLGVRETVRNIMRIIRENKINLIHSNSIRTHIYAVLSAWQYKIPVIWHQRNLIEKEIVDPDRALAFLPDAIICNSAAIACRFMRGGRFPAKVRTIYNGVDTTRFSPLVKGDEMRREFDIAHDEIVIGIASRFSPNKAHEIFLSAAQRVLKDAADNRRSIRILIAGGAVFAEDLDREQVLRDLIKSLGIEDRVVLTGFRKDMPKIYAMTDIFVLASEAEPCGRVIFEAMATGKPIVATNAGGTPEIVADGVTGILVPAKDPDAMARALKTLLENRDKREEMGRWARKRAEEFFSIEKNVRKTEELYYQLLKL